MGVEEYTAKAKANVKEHLAAYSPGHARDLLLQMANRKIEFIRMVHGGDGARAPELYAAAEVYICAANDIVGQG